MSQSLSSSSSGVRGIHRDRDGVGPISASGIEAFALELLNGMQRSGGPLGHGLVTTHIIDTVHFVRSETNSGVQITDLVAYLLNRIRRIRPELGRPADVALRAMFEEFVAPAIRTYRQTWP